MKPKINTDELYPIKKASEMSDDEFSRWWALAKALSIIYDHAEQYDIDPDDLNLNTKKIIDEYVTPMSGDILHNIRKERQDIQDNEAYDPGNKFTIKLERTPHPLFIKNHKYALINIESGEEELSYTFKNLSRNVSFKLKFKDSSKGDDFIDMILKCA